MELSPNSLIISLDQQTLVYLHRVEQEKDFSYGTGVCLHSVHESSIGVKLGSINLAKFIPYKGQLSPKQSQIIVDYQKGKI